MAVHGSHRQNNSNGTSSPACTTVKAKKTAMSSKAMAKENVSNVPGEEHNDWVQEKETAWDWKYLNDFSSRKVPPLFSKDGRYFFCLAGVSIKIFSVASGQVVSELVLPPERTGGTQSSPFTSALINPHNFFQLITSTLDGKLLIWDFLNATLLRQIDIGQSIHFLCAHESFKDSVLAAASLFNNKRAAGDHDAVVLQISLKTAAPGKSSEIRAIGKTRFPSGLAFSANGSWIVASAGHTVYVANSAALDAGFVKYVSPERLTCLAMHPFEDYFATGDEKGVVRIWYCLNSNAAGSRGVEQRSQTTSLHWHAHAVSALSFTPNGGYLLSGGEEAVLVIWQIHSGKKEFVPRVGSVISTISICQTSANEEYLLGLNDGTFSFVSSSTLRITRSFSQIKIDSGTVGGRASSSRLTPPPLAYHPLSSSIILPSSHPQSLQMYSPLSSTLVSELEVSPSNRVSRRDDKPLETSRVEHVALSSCGLWMATLDARNGEVGYPPEIFLKIWAWNEQPSEWTLHSRIDQPHRTSHVVDITFSPQYGRNPLYLSSFGEDGTVQVWRLKLKTRTVVWSPHASLDLSTSPPCSLSWSPDGTIFSVSLGFRIVLYDSASIAVVSTISCPVIKDASSSHFIGNHYLLITTETGHLLWDLILQSRTWTYSIVEPITGIVPHPDAESFVVLSDITREDGHATMIRVFDVTSPLPQLIQPIPLKLRTAIWFGAPDGTRNFRLVALTDSSKAITLGNDPNITPSKPSLLSLRFSSQKPSLFQDIFGSPLDVAVPSAMPSARQKNSGQDSFPHPAYLTPSLSSLYSPILKGFLRIREDHSSTTIQQENVDSDEEMEDDVTGVLLAQKPLTTQLTLPNDQFVQFFKATLQQTSSQISGIAKLTNGVGGKEGNHASC